MLPFARPSGALISRATPAIIWPSAASGNLDRLRMGSLEALEFLLSLFDGKVGGERLPPLVFQRDPQLHDGGQRAQQQQKQRPVHRQFPRRGVPDDGHAPPSVAHKDNLSGAGRVSHPEST
jgi:hypothetical protein